MLLDNLFHSCRRNRHLSLRWFLFPQREERIQRNNAILEQLGVHTAAQALAAGRGRRPPQRLKRKAPVKAAVRKCARLSRQDQEGPKKENLKALNTGILLQLQNTTGHSVYGVQEHYMTCREQSQSAKLRACFLAEHDELMTLRDYFKWKGQDVNGIIVDGQYRG